MRCVTWLMAAVMALQGVVAVADELLKATNSITTLTVDQAKDLAQRKGGDLSLDRLTTLAPDAAKALAKHEGGLILSGLTTLSDEVAKELGQHKGELYLDGLTKLSDEAAESLAQHMGALSFDGLTTLSDKAAKALAQHKGAETNLLAFDLSLNGLITLSDEAAKAFGQHKGELSLSGLTTLSSKSAEALGQHESYLYLRGLTKLSDEAAKSLRAKPNICLPQKFKADPITGRVVSVNEGDSLTVLDEGNTQRLILLQGIDAPEPGQPFGAVSRDRLIALVKGKTVTIYPHASDKWNRAVGTVEIDGDDLCCKLVDEGLAWHNVKFDKDARLAAAEREARAARRGLWSEAKPVAPWEWRAGERERKSAAAGR
jgi:endonuclease YncB( thermonuclease family)